MSWKVSPPMYPIRFIAFVAFACLRTFPSVAASSDLSPQSQSSSGQSASAPESGPTVLRANANLVLVDVVVSERGNAVHGLDQRQFHIFEDGKEQAITSFDEHQPAAGSAAHAKTAALPPFTYTNAPAYPEAPLSTCCCWTR